MKKKQPTTTELKKAFQKIKPFKCQQATITTTPSNIFFTQVIFTRLYFQRLIFYKSIIQVLCNFYTQKKIRKRVTMRASRFLILFNLRDFLQFNIIIYFIHIFFKTPCNNNKTTTFSTVIL